VFIKICGVTRPADAELCAGLGVDAIGLNFYPQSPRRVDREQARQIVEVLPAEVDPVGVWVAPSAADLDRVSTEVGLRTAQLHAMDTAGVPSGLKATGRRFILAHGVAVPEDLVRLWRLVDLWQQAGLVPAAVLLDARAQGLHGGTGQIAPWNLIAGWERRLPLILAGGLTPENVAEAIRIVRPFGVDVASGVESAPGIKDGLKLRQFVEQAREADSQT
jgi:phosphoribosylanthranilate isomerase